MAIVFVAISASLGHAQTDWYQPHVFYVADYALEPAASDEELWFLLGHARPVSFTELFLPHPNAPSDESLMLGDTLSPQAYQPQFESLVGSIPMDEELSKIIQLRNKTLGGRIVSDYVNFYSSDSLAMLAGGLAVGGVIANTRLDRDIQSHLHSSLYNATTDDWLHGLHANKELGNGLYTIPVFAGAWAIGEIMPESQFSEASRTWGERTIRGFVVGAPSVLLLQQITGGSRPDEMSYESHWHPFADNNGVSGHSFMGSLPFITAAKMTDSVGWKATFYAASTLAPISRMSDSAHYPSQVALGWWISFLAASAVQATDKPNSKWRVYPTIIGNASGMAMEYRF